MLSSLSVILTGFDRVRIRATYGINGNCPTDFARALFCPCCTLMNNDREVRAREGEMRLRNTKGYKTEVEMMQVQPAHSQPMRYVSPRQTSELRGSEENQASSARERHEQLQAGQSSPTAETSGKNVISNYKYQKRSGEDKTLLGRTNLAREKSKLIGDEADNCSTTDKNLLTNPNMPASEQSLSTIGVVHEAKKDLLDESKAVAKGFDTNPASGRAAVDKNNPKSPVTTSPHELSECPRPESTVQQVTDLSGSISHQHALIECSTIEIEDVTVDKQAKPHLLADCTTIETDGGDTYSQHTLVECSTVEIGDPTVQLEPLSHTLADCATIKVDAKENARSQHTLTGCETVFNTSTATVDTKLKTHLLADCTTIKVDVREDARKDASRSQHTFSDCDTVVTSTIVLEQHRLSECDTITHEAQELSYVHDFTDCPVDKSILEYYEKEEKRAQQKQSGSANRLKSSNSSFQHALTDCPAGRATISNAARQHRRASYTPIRGEGHNVGQHRLSSCPIPGTERCKDAIAAHHLAENAGIAGSDDSQATQKPLARNNKGKMRADDEHAHSERCLTESLHHNHGSSEQVEKGSSSGSSTEMKASEDPAGHEHTASKDKSKADIFTGRFKHKKHQKNTFDSKVKGLHVKSKGSKSPRPSAHSAQHALEQVLASKSGQKESSKKNGAVESQKEGCNDAGQTKIDSGSGSPRDSHSIEQLEKVGSQEEQKSQSNGISNIFSKMSLKSKGYS